MRYVLIAVLAVLAAGCGPREMDALTYSHELYIGCLRMKEPAECETQRAAFEANRGYSDSMSRRAAARPPLVLQTYTPPPAPAPVYRPTVICTTAGNTVMCN